MSSNSLVSSLPSPLRDLVANAAPRDEDYGVNEKDKSEVSEWIAKVAKGDIAQPSAAKELDVTLTPKTYLVSNYLTAADVALYGALHPTLVSYSVVCMSICRLICLWLVPITDSSVLFAPRPYPLLRSHSKSSSRQESCGCSRAGILSRLLRSGQYAED